MTVTVTKIDSSHESGKNFKHGHGLLRLQSFTITQYNKLALFKSQ
jgi:hypothetical protein